jgi:hypothetical protein
MTDTITIGKPHVPFGPHGIPEHKADADYLRHAARNIEGGYAVGGYNVTRTVINLLHSVADALELEGERQAKAERDAAALLAEYEAKP